MGRRKMIDNLSNYEFSSKIIEQDYVPVLVNNIQKVRESLKINQSTLSKYLQKSKKNYQDNKDIFVEGRNEVICTHQRIGFMERGESIPTVSIAFRISDVLGVNINDIYQLVYLKNEDYVKLVNSKYDKKNNAFVPSREVEEIKEKIKEEFDRLIKNEAEAEKEIAQLKRELIKLRNKHCVIKNGNVILGSLWNEIKEEIEFLSSDSFGETKKRPI